MIIQKLSLKFKDVEDVLTNMNNKNSVFVITSVLLLSSFMIPINDAFAATTFVDAFSVSAQETTVTGLAFNSDGTEMFVVGDSGDDVNEYACTAFDVSTCSFTDAFSVSGQEQTPRNVAFNTDGTKMFVVGNSSDKVYEYACTTNNSNHYTRQRYGPEVLPRPNVLLATVTCAQDELGRPWHTPPSPPPGQYGNAPPPSQTNVSSEL